MGAGSTPAGGVLASAGVGQGIYELVSLNLAHLLSTIV